MDWTGPFGYMFAVRKFDDIFIASRLCTLLMPVYLSEMNMFLDILDSLFRWRQQHIYLKNNILPAVHKIERESFYSVVLGKSSVQMLDSPNIIPYPTRSQKGKSVINAGDDTPLYNITYDFEEEEGP